MRWAPIWPEFPNYIVHSFLITLHVVTTFLQHVCWKLLCGFFCWFNGVIVIICPWGIVWSGKTTDSVEQRGVSYRGIDDGMPEFFRSSFSMFIIILQSRSHVHINLFAFWFRSYFSWELFCFDKVVGDFHMEIIFARTIWFCLHFGFNLFILY